MPNCKNKEVNMMTDRIKVDPTPIQRNAFDVAIELVNLHIRLDGRTTASELEALFAS